MTPNGDPIFSDDYKIFTSEGSFPQQKEIITPIDLDMIHFKHLDNQLLHIHTDINYTKKTKKGIGTMFTFSKGKKQKMESMNQQENSPDQSKNKLANNIDTSLSMKLEAIKKRTGNSSDIVIGPLNLSHNPKV